MGGFQVGLFLAAANIYTQLPGWDFCLAVQCSMITVPFSSTFPQVEGVGGGGPLHFLGGGGGDLMHLYKLNTVLFSLYKQPSRSNTNSFWRQPADIFIYIYIYIYINIYIYVCVCVCVCVCMFDTF